MNLSLSPFSLISSSLPARSFGNNADTSFTGSPHLRAASCTARVPVSTLVRSWFLETCGVDMVAVVGEIEFEVACSSMELEGITLGFRILTTFLPIGFPWTGVSNSRRTKRPRDAVSVQTKMRVNLFEAGPFLINERVQRKSQPFN